MQAISTLHAIFIRTRDHIGSFRAMIQPFIDQSTDQHTKLYYHHISEEEEQRLERLEELIPSLEQLKVSDELTNVSDRELSRLLNDLHLERFGLHNFREHLELALYEFKEEPYRSTLLHMLEQTQQDYLTTKEIMTQLSETFSNVAPHKLKDHDAGHDVHQMDHRLASSPASLQISTHTKKGLTVGSLRHV